MASGTKSGGVFTGNSTAKGKSEGMFTQSINAGKHAPGDQKILSAFPQDNVHGLDLPNTRGGPFKGSDTNLSHSLTGASAVQRGAGEAGGGGVKYTQGD